MKKMYKRYIITNLTTELKEEASMVASENLNELYYDARRADNYGSAEGLKRQSTLKNVEGFLRKQDAYTVHRNLKRRFKRCKTYVTGIDHLWQIDLVDLSSLAHSNGGYRYLLTCIDVFSKYGRVAVSKTKSATTVRDAFESMIQETKPGCSTFSRTKDQNF